MPRLRFKERGRTLATASFRDWTGGHFLSPKAHMRSWPGSRFAGNGWRKFMASVIASRRWSEIAEYLQVLNDLLAARAQQPADHVDAQVRLNQFLEAVRKEDETRTRREDFRQLWMRASEAVRHNEDTLLQATFRACTNKRWSDSRAKRRQTQLARNTFATSAHLAWGRR